MVGWRPLKDDPEHPLTPDFITSITCLFPHLFPYLIVPTPLNPLRSVDCTGVNYKRPKDPLRIWLGRLCCVDWIGWVLGMTV